MQGRRVWVLRRCYHEDTCSEQGFNGEWVVGVFVSCMRGLILGSNPSFPTKHKEGSVACHGGEKILSTVRTEAQPSSFKPSNPEP